LLSFSHLTIIVPLKPAASNGRICLRKSKNTYVVLCETTASLTITSSETARKFTFIIDLEDLPRVRALHWRLIFSPAQRAVYARAHFSVPGNLSVALHELILSFGNDRTTRVIDHIDRDTLNNRKSNLRIVSKRVNAYNRHPNKSKRGVLPRGVYQTKNGKFVARYSDGKKTINLGTYLSLENAHAAYLTHSGSHHGI
jgi:hypothetical protein